MSEFYRQTYVQIDLEILKSNYLALAKQLSPHQKIFVVVKANAYGHGAAAVVSSLSEWGVTLFGVATLDEALALRNQNIKVPLYVLDGLQGPAEIYKHHQLLPVIHQFEEIQKIKNSGLLHLGAAVKIDTGMGRLGFFIHEVPNAIEEIREAKIDLKAVFSHLPNADTHPNETQIAEQKLLSVKANLDKAGFSEVPFSLHNSAAFQDGPSEPLSWYRLGLALYGVYSHARNRASLPIKPVLSWHTQIMSLKKFPPNSSIGYGSTYQTKTETLVAILPVGYADGYPRNLSNKAYVLIDGHRAPVIGRISMDLTAIDVSPISGVRLNQEVVLIGQSGSETLLVDALANWAQVLPYEILCGLSARVPRKYTGLNA